MAITKQQRALVVITNLDAQNWEWLYEFLSASGDALANSILNDNYAIIKRLRGNNATLDRFIDALQDLGSKPEIKKIDVIINLHGRPNKLQFDDGAFSMNTIKTRIIGLNIGSKLRMLYSTACFGAGHAVKFVEAGFDVAAGAVGVNANSAVEYPVVLTMWQNNQKFNNCIAAGENPVTRLPADTLARVMGFSGVNSDKVIIGNGNIRISS